MRTKLLPLLLTFVFLVGCISAQKDCDVKKIILETSVFPGDVLADSLVSPIHDGPSESASREFYVKAGSSWDWVLQDIMNFRFVSSATNFYNDRNEQAFRTDEGSWDIPLELKDINLAADQSHLACGTSLSQATCRWMARYEQYYIYLTSFVSKSGMTIPAFGNAVKEIDARMVQCLRK